MPEPTRRLDALTIDQLRAIRDALPDPPSRPSAIKQANRGYAPMTGKTIGVCDLEHAPLNVSLNCDANVVTFRFNGAQANLDMVQAKTLAVALADCLNEWRGSITAREG